MCPCNNASSHCRRRMRNIGGYNYLNHDAKLRGEGTQVLLDENLGNVILATCASDIRPDEAYRSVITGRCL